MAETIILDATRTMDSWILPAMERYQRAKDVIHAYPYDPARAVQLLEEAGYRGGPTSVMAPSGERLRIEYRSGGAAGAKEMSLACANWRAIGVLCDEQPTSGPLGQDAEWTANYPWFNGTAGPASMGFISRRLHTSQIPTAEKRWQGSNDGGIRDAEVDRLVDLYNRSVSVSEQERVEIELARVVSSQAYVYPLYSEVTVMAIRKGITGPRPMAAVGVSGDLWNTWNVHEWDRT
jgi:peptide/nickel transport system substrate-binding protein